MNCCSDDVAELLTYATRRILPTTYRVGNIPLVHMPLAQPTGAL